MDWDSAPHLMESQKKELWASIPPYQRDARFAPRKAAPVGETRQQAEGGLMSRIAVIGSKGRVA